MRPGLPGLREEGPLLLSSAHLRAGTPGPHTLQGLLGCELNPDNTSVPVAKFALDGEDFMEFDLKLGAWNGDWPEALAIGQRWARQADAVNNEKTFLLYSCPHRLLGHLERGRGNLEWKGELPPDSLLATLSASPRPACTPPPTATHPPHGPIGSFHTQS